MSNSLKLQKKDVGNLPRSIFWRSVRAFIADWTVNALTEMFRNWILETWPFPSFQFHLCQRTADRSYPSTAAFIADANLPCFNDHRHFAHALWILEHLVQLIAIWNHIKILKIGTGFFECLPGCIGVWSCVFAVDAYLLGHAKPPYLKMGCYWNTSTWVGWQQNSPKFSTVTLNRTEFK